MREFESRREHEIRTYQTRVSEMQTIGQLIPYLTGGEEQKRIALLTLNLLGSSEFATQFAKHNPSEGAESAADVIMATAPSVVQQRIPLSVTATATLTPASPRKEGWAYLGHYVRSSGTWRTRYFDFSNNATPSSLRGQVLEVYERTGSLNVRDGMPTPSGQFPEVIDVLKPGSKALAGEIQEWQSSGFFWARISYAVN